MISEKNRTQTDELQDIMKEQEIYLAAGCFWGAQKFFKLVDGVTFTEVGFANGDTAAPTYQQVYTDTTGIYYEDPDSDLPDIEAVIGGFEKEAGKRVAIEVVPLRRFYRAEDFHQDYLDKNPEGYCHLSPEIFSLTRKKA